MAGLPKPRVSEVRHIMVTPSTYAAWHLLDSSHWLFHQPTVGTRVMGDAYLYSGVTRPFIPAGVRRPGGVR